MIRTGHNYKAVLDRCGFATVTRLSDGASIFLQGDDAVEVESQLDAVDATSEQGYPIGPFKDYKSHLDAILDAYDDGSMKVETGE